jgi:glycosyltransferase involved in cell wall biosynthesis
MNAPKVSVILPTYNRATLLGTAIESVLGQSFQDLELIVVDDGSADDTEKLVRRYQDSDARVRYLRQANRGISAAMNAGIHAASGQLIARLDSDDLWLPDLLETEVSILEARPEIGLVYSRGQWMDQDLNPLATTVGQTLHFPNDTLGSMLWGDATCNITVVARRECFDRAGFFDEALATSEDWDMWLRTAFHYDFVFVDRVLAHVRRHEGNATSAQVPSYAAFLGSRRKVLDKFFSRGDLSPRIARMRAIAYRNLYIYEGNIWVAFREWKRALRAFGRAIRAGGNPGGAAARIAWFNVVHPILGRTAGGRNFLRWESNLRGRLRGLTFRREAGHERR